MPESVLPDHARFPPENLPLERISSLMREAGCAHLYVKELAVNDDSKRQIYLTTDLSAFNMFPSQMEDNPPMPKGIAATQKPQRQEGENRIFGHLAMSWIGLDGSRCEANLAKLIYYPQYPEVRLSGFLKGVDNVPSMYLREKSGEQFSNRLLFLGTTSAGDVIALLAVGHDSLRDEVRHAHSHDDEVVLNEVALYAPAESPRQELVHRLAIIHRKKWIAGKRLSAEGVVPYDAPNAIGYTLEAELGVMPNGDNAPDFMGWEVKAHTVTSFDSTAARVVTLFTPEPDLGVYCDESVFEFIRRWGYIDLKGRPDRRNFGGIHRVGHVHERTGLRLAISGYERDETGRVDPTGHLSLVASDGEIAAGWSFRKLLDRWQRKHSATVYVPARRRTTHGLREFCFGTSVLLCEETHFQLVLDAMYEGVLYLDPAVKAEGWSSGTPVIKRRNQFRMKRKDVGCLYRRSGVVNVCGESRTC